jgi:ATP adenylyltransferase
VIRVSRDALAQGASQPIPTKSEFVEDGGITFLVRVVANLANKPIVNNEEGPSANTQNPFLPYDPRMFVADVSPTHVCLLNKYNVVEHHLLIVTRDYESQESPLTFEDFEALWTCMAEYDGLGFYNSGTVSGASQPHKHLQLVPLPLASQGPRVPLEPLLKQAVLTEHLGSSNALPFCHSLVKVSWKKGSSPSEVSKTTFEHYHAMLRVLGVDSASSVNDRLTQPYNLLITRQWMLLVPRSREFFGPVSLNALAFAGALLVRNQTEFADLKRQGPMEALRHVSYPLQSANPDSA